MTALRSPKGAVDGDEQDLGAGSTSTGADGCQPGRLCAGDTVPRHHRQTGLNPIFEGASDFDLELVEHRTLDGHTQEPDRRSLKSPVPVGVDMGAAAQQVFRGLLADFMGADQSGRRTSCCRESPAATMNRISMELSTLLRGVPPRWVRTSIPTSSGGVRTAAAAVWRRTW